MNVLRKSFKLACCVITVMTAAAISSCATNATVYGVPKNVWKQLTPDQQQQFQAAYQKQMKREGLQPTADASTTNSENNVSESATPKTAEKQNPNKTQVAAIQTPQSVQQVQEWVGDTSDPSMPMQPPR